MYRLPRTLYRLPSALHQPRPHPLYALHPKNFTAKMSTTRALYTSESLKANNATPFSAMQSKVDPSLLQAVKQMGYDYMTPVQEQVLSKLAPLNRDW